MAADGFVGAPPTMAPPKGAEVAFRGRVLLPTEAEGGARLGAGSVLGPGPIVSAPGALSARRAGAAAAGDDIGGRACPNGMAKSNQRETSAW